jgi:uncharacterized membrane-anchored protein YitT (DUF2179 family)
MNNDKSYKGKIKKFLLINIGIFLISVGVYFFKFPNKFATGGVSGISIILNKLLPYISQATYMTIINIILLVVGFIAIGKKFGIMTTYCSLVFSGETWLLEKMIPMSQPFTDQPLLELMFAIFLPAAGSAILFNCNASSGGTDVVAMILKKYTDIDIGKALLISDGIIALSTGFVFGIKVCLFSVLGLMIKAFMIDSIIESFNECKYFTIVTSKPEEISEFIIKDLKHSATILDAVGAYTNTEKKVVITACRRSQALKLRQYCKKIDAKSFMFITNTSEIIGKGFREI